MAAAWLTAPVRPRSSELRGVCPFCRRWGATPTAVVASEEPEKFQYLGLNLHVSRDLGLNSSAFQKIGLNMRIASRFRISGIFSHLYFFLKRFHLSLAPKMTKVPLASKTSPCFLHTLLSSSIRRSHDSQSRERNACRPPDLRWCSIAGQRPPALHRPLSPPPSPSSLALQSAAIPIRRPALRSSCSRLGFRLDPKRRLGSWAGQSACAHGSRTPCRCGSWRGAAPAASPAAPTTLVAEPVWLAHVNGDVRGTGQPSRLDARGTLVILGAR